MLSVVEDTCSIFNAFVFIQLSSESQIQASLYVASRLILCIISMVSNI